MHMLVNCPTISAFWSEVFRWWNDNTKSKYEVDDLAIMCGFNLGDHTCVIFNYVILIAKWHIYLEFRQNFPLLCFLPGATQEKSCIRKKNRIPYMMVNLNSLILSGNQSCLCSNYRQRVSFVC